MLVWVGVLRLQVRRKARRPESDSTANETALAALTVLVST